jgi:hypothetical protein
MYSYLLKFTYSHVVGRITILAVILATRDVKIIIGDRLVTELIKWDLTSRLVRSVVSR